MEDTPEVEISQGTVRNKMYLINPTRTILFTREMKSKKYRGFEVGAGQTLNLPYEALIALRAEFGTVDIYDVTMRTISALMNKIFARK